MLHLYPWLLVRAYGERSLKETPTWAVALVCAVFVIISVLIEHGIHSLGKWFQKHQKKAMTEALEKIKAGFISLLITVGTQPISKICIPAKAGDVMLPCKNYNDKYDKGGYGRRILFLYAEDSVWHRVLAAAGGDDYCSKDCYDDGSGAGQNEKMESMGTGDKFLGVSIYEWKLAVGVPFNFFVKLRSKFFFLVDPSRFRFTHQISFVRRHTGFSTSPCLRWIVAFFRQFFASVSKVDCVTMRHGFINAHFPPSSKFDFHKYIKRSMEDDFKVVVGISMPLWTFAIIFQLLNVHGWYTLFWISFIPLATLLMVGAKLELIITEMAQQIQERTTVVKGAPIVEPSNNFFWFNRPDLILFLIHFTLFQNAFQMAYFLWIWYEFGLNSGFHEKRGAIVARVLVGVALQMGSHMKKAIFEEQTTKALRKWQKAAKDRKKLRKAGADVSSGFISGETTPSEGSSPIHLLHKYKPNTADIESVTNSPTNYHSETDLSEIEASSDIDHEPRRHIYQQFKQQGGKDGIGRFYS